MVELATSGTSNKFSNQVVAAGTTTLCVTRKAYMLQEVDAGALGGSYPNIPEQDVERRLGSWKRKITKEVTPSHFYFVGIFNEGYWGDRTRYACAKEASFLNNTTLQRAVVYSMSSTKNPCMTPEQQPPPSATPNQRQTATRPQRPNNCTQCQRINPFRFISRRQAPSSAL